MDLSPYISDFVVIGAGLVGALVARRLAEADLKVAILESRQVPGGFARYGAGVALLGTPEPFTDLQAQRGTDMANEIWQLTQENLTSLSDTLQALAQEVHRSGSLRLTEGTEQAKRLQQSVVDLEQQGYTVALEDATAHGYLVALRTQHDITFDPQVLVDALLDHPNIILETDTEVQSFKLRDAVDDTSPTIAIWAHKHYILTSKIVLANGAYAVQLSSSLQDVLAPLQIHAIDFKYTKSLTPPWVLEGGHVILQALPDRWRLVGWPFANQDVLTLLTQVAQQVCPEAPVLARHSGWVAQSRDHLPVVGMLPNFPGVYVINGLGPWGTSWAFVAVDRLVNLILHKKDPGLFNIKRLVA